MQTKFFNAKIPYCGQSWTICHAYILNLSKLAVTVECSECINTLPFTIQNKILRFCHIVTNKRNGKQSQLYFGSSSTTNNNNSSNSQTQYAFRVQFNMNERLKFIQTFHEQWTLMILNFESIYFRLVYSFVSSLVCLVVVFIFHWIESGNEYQIDWRWCQFHVVCYVTIICSIRHLVCREIQVSAAIILCFIFINVLDVISHLLRLQWNLKR